MTFEEAEIPCPRRARAARKARCRSTPAPRDGRWVDYARFSSDLVAQAITGLAAAIKTLSAGRLLVAVSYGYTLEFATRSDSGHLALARVLASPDIDIVAGPNSYAGRGAGGTGAFGAPVNSVALHGKLWLVEDDTKTFLAEAETPDTYNPKIASRRRHAGRPPAPVRRGAGPRGRRHLDGPVGPGLAGQPRHLARSCAACATRPASGRKITAGRQAPDVAVLVDEASLAYLKNDPAGLGQSLIGKTRDLLLRAGASVGFYLQSDVTRTTSRTPSCTCS